jgi:hypothetical protein
MPKVNRRGKPDAAERFARYREAQVPICDAIRLALSADPFDRELTKRAIPDFAARNGLDPKNTAHVIYGNRRATDTVCGALARELGRDTAFWKNLLSPAREAAATA